ncbi:MAG: sulfite reductase subunit alpha, partial [Opitutales bacterium]
FPVPGLSASDFCGLLRQMPPRLYSIASSLKAHPEEVHLTIAIVRYHSHGRDREGVCSTLTADRVNEGETMPVYMHGNKRFKLPEDGETPIIMVGPGTGIAPFRAFVEERIATGVTSKSWLFFGNQHRETDYLYGDEWERYLDEGKLSRIDLAFSRDQDYKIYVQHRMLEHAAEMWTWLNAGAVFYVCGDASRMAKDVHEALITIAEKEGGKSREDAEAWVKQLNTDKRYRKDVY